MNLRLRFLLMCLIPIGTFAQTITDGLMMSKNDLCTGIMFSQEKWTDYWEGELKRENKSIGTFTSRSIMWVGTYGITDKLNVIAMLPYIKNNFDFGPLMEMKGIQDLTLAVKYNFLTSESAAGKLKFFAALAASVPLSDYTPDFYPLSLGSHTTNLSWRLTGNFKLQQGFYINASGAYTWRSNTTLDRDSYFTKDNLYMTNEVQMPNVFDYTVGLGYLKNNIQGELYYLQQNTLGGGDIRRQDMPFVSNRMNFSKGGALIMYYVPKPKGLAVRGSATTTFAGRNVGKSTMLSAGLLYTIHFSKSQPE